METTPFTLDDIDWAMNSLTQAPLVSRAERKEKLAPKREGSFVMTRPYRLKACKCVQEQAFHRRSRGSCLKGTEKGKRARLYVTCTILLELLYKCNIS